jgi:ferredoxin
MVKVNKELCIGCGTCVSICSECFQLGADNKAEAIESCDQNAHAEKINQAKDACPVQAIEVT